MRMPRRRGKRLVDEGRADDCADEIEMPPFAMRTVQHMRGRRMDHCNSRRSCARTMR